MPKVFQALSCLGAKIDASIVENYAAVSKEYRLCKNLIVYKNNNNNLD